MSAQHSSDLELVEEFEDADLQSALALSLQECRPAVAAGAAGTAAAAVDRDQQTQQGPAAGQQEGKPVIKKQARQPMRGRRLQPQSPQEQAVAQPPQHQPSAAAPSKPGKASSEVPAQRAAGPSGRGKAQPQQPSPAAAAAAAKPSGSRQPRKRKLPAFNPSEAEVEACFASLAAGSSVVTVESLVEVSQAVGGDLNFAGGKNMMAYAGDKVLGWGSGAGRAQGATGVLSLPAFRQVIDHFRI